MCGENIQRLFGLAGAQFAARDAVDRPGEEGPGRVAARALNYRGLTWLTSGTYCPVRDIACASRVP